MPPTDGSVTNDTLGPIIQTTPFPNPIRTMDVLPISYVRQENPWNRTIPTNPIFTVDYQNDTAAMEFMLSQTVQDIMEVQDRRIGMNIVNWDCRRHIVVGSGCFKATVSFLVVL